MAALSIGPAVFKRLVGLQSIPISHAPEDASEAFKVGALLVEASATGQISECGTDPAVVQGLALHAASGTQAKDVAYIKLMPGVIIEISVDESGGQGSYAAVQTDVGLQYGVAKDSSTGYWYLDQDETSTKVFTVRGIVSAIGDTTPRYEVEIALAAME